MRLYFLRHAEAIPGEDDAARPLSDRGKEQCREVGKFLEKVEIEFDAAFSSPLVRARQTAERVLKLTQKTETSEPQIDPILGLDTEEVAFGRWLNELGEFRHVLLVGHAPSLADHARRLLGIKQTDAFELPKAGLACLRTDDRRKATLKFFVSPKILC